MMTAKKPSKIRKQKKTTKQISPIVTDQISAKRKAQKSGEQFRELADTLPHMVWTIEPDGRISYINKRWAQWTGFTIEEINKGKWSEVYHPDDLPKLAKEWENAFKSKKAFTWEYRIKNPGGGYSWFMGATLPIKDKKGKISRWIGTATNIDEKKQSEGNLAFLSEASKILSSSLDYKKTLNAVAKLAVPHIADWCAVELLGDNGQLQLVSVTHKDPAKVKWAKQLRKTNPPDMNAPTGLPNVLRTGKSELYPKITDELLVQSAKNKKELELLRKLNLTSVMIVPIRLGNKIIGGISFVTTETGRQYTKSDVAMAEELATRSGLAIESARLYKEMQKAVSLRDDFISIASHELKTPLTSLKMYTQLLSRQFTSKANGEAKNFFRKMDDQLNELTGLINDLLDISKIQHGKLEFKMENIDINELIKDTFEALYSTTKKFNIIIQGQVDRNVYGDRYRIFQVLTNLLTNAIKYSPKADKIVVRLESTKDKAIVSVQDFGIGIGKEDQGKIFDQFYRVTNPEEKITPGLGMGLYITNEIVRRHGGKLQVISEKGKGSTFSFTLPYGRIKAQKAPKFSQN